MDADRFTIETADLEGGDRRIVKRISHTQFYDIAVFRVNAQYSAPLVQLRI